MKTQIFQTKTEFSDRTDKSFNGVSPEFAAENPNWESQNQSNDGCWNCYGCSDCYGCSRCYDCSDCYGCSRCYDCSRCSHCSGLEIKSKQSDTPNLLISIPVIQNIHQKVLEAVSKPESLEMGDWHSCNTTHCRGGWVITLAGEAGRILESQTSPEFSAMMIYKASSPIRVPPVRFHESNEVAMADIKRCAKEESEITTP